METVHITTKACWGCGKTSQLLIPAAGLALYESGVLVQEAFPFMSASEREMLITGTHPTCWVEMMGEEQ